MTDGGRPDFSEGDQFPSAQEPPEARELKTQAPRELRRVPLNWQHPKDKHGQYKPLIGRGEYTEADIQGFIKDGTMEPGEQVEMPDFSGVPDEEMGIAAYETTSEGTPVSGVYPDTPEGRFLLLQDCTRNTTVFGGVKTGIEAWAGSLFGEGNAVVDPIKETVTVRVQKKT